MQFEQKLGLAVRMQQRLIMTPSLQQAIKLLQMSKLELVEEVAQEIVDNPLSKKGRAPRPAPIRPRGGSAKEAASTTEVEVTPDKAPYEEIDYESSSRTSRAATCLAPPSRRATSFRPTRTSSPARRPSPTTSSGSSTCPRSRR